MLSVREMIHSPFSNPTLRYEAVGWYRGLWFDIPFKTYTEAWVFAHSRNTHPEDLTAEQLQAETSTIRR